MTEVALPPQSLHDDPAAAPGADEPDASATVDVAAPHPATLDHWSRAALSDEALARQRRRRTSITF